ncbi:ATP/GTP-binding protein [Actinocorallia herbida]|uniref:ATP/GTP-binding protein n=1 Tax=Actinocorallia herbida TaxID=58109 RepID=UPI000F4CE72F|nr:ATP/GTP-binding protein [Actinocorallia herbida]
MFRTNNRALTPVDVFANRIEEWEAVRRSLAAVVAQRRAADFDVEDVQHPRHNVLALYGVGGIGKSTLSQRIAERLSGAPGPEHWTALDERFGRVLPVRIDLSHQAGAGFESVMLAVRLALAEIGRPLAAFDLALARYWEHRHPGEPLEDYLRSHTFLNRYDRGGNLREQMASTVGELAQLVGIPGAALAGRALHAAVRSLRERGRNARALSGCRRLPDILEAEPTEETLAYAAHLLAWDLAQIPAADSVTPVVLLDTFEDVGDRVHRDLERLIQRMVWLMPNVLFIVTGRNRLRWDDQGLEGQLDWVGPECWPNLVPGATADPRQYRVGYLSPQDGEDYLSRRLVVDERALIGEEIRRVLVRRSGGLPLYLDLAVMRFLDLHERTGNAPAVDEFDAEFPALLARIFRDLSDEERDVLRAVSLFDSFSVDLAAAAAGLDRDSAVLRLTDRPFVETAPGAVWPYHLHELVRTAVRSADTSSEDRWSERDWRRAAQRAFDALGAEFERGGREPSRRVLLGCLRQGLSLARDHDLDLGWLADAAYAYVQDFVWEPIESGSSTNLDAPATALAASLSAIAQRQRQHRSLTAERLREVLAAGTLPAGLRELPIYFLAECERDLGNLTVSLEGMRAVADGGGRLAPDAARGILHLTRRLGHFPEAIAAAEGLGAEGKKERTVGEILWTQGSIGPACASFAQARDLAVDRRQHGEAALCQAYLAFSAAFADRARAIEQIDRADHMLRGSQARFAELQVTNARLLADAGHGSDLLDRATEAATLASHNGLSSCVAYAKFALCFHAAVIGAPDLLRTGREWLGESVRGAEFAYLVELTYFMTGEQAPADLPRARWIDGTEATRARWTGLVLDRRREISGRRGE